MRHLKSGRKLGMPKSHRDSMLANLATSILDKERIVTTLAKAKEARSVVERLITFGKKGGLNSIRHAGKTITDKTILHKLFSDIAPSFKDREGGYTRIIKVGERKGDNALLAIIELTGRGGEEIARLRKKKRKNALPGAPAQAAPVAKAEKTPAKADKPAKEKAASKSKDEKPKVVEKDKNDKVKAVITEESVSGVAEEASEKPASEKAKVKKAPKVAAEKPKKAPKEKSK